MKKVVNSPLSQRDMDLLAIDSKHSYQRVWLIKAGLMLLQAKGGAMLYDIATKKVKHTLAGVSLPIADYLLLSENVLLTSSNKGTVQIWTIPNTADSCQALQPVAIKVSNFKIVTLAKYTDNQFIAADVLHNLSIWRVDNQKQVFKHKFPFNVINASSDQKNVLNLIGMADSLYSKVKFTLDEKQSTVLWQSSVNGIVSNLDIVRVIDQAKDEMTIIRAKKAPSTDAVVWLEQKNKDGKKSLRSIVPKEGECVTTVSRSMSSVCFFYPSQNTAQFSTIDDSVEQLTNSVYA